MNRNLVLAGIAIALVALAGYSYFSQPEPASEGSGPPIVAVTMPELTIAQRRGEVAFNENCAACHGRNAAGQEEVAPPLVHRIYEPSHHGDQIFYLAAQNGVRQHHWPFGDMPPVEGVTQQDVASIVEYVRALQRANGIN